MLGHWRERPASIAKASCAQACQQEGEDVCREGTEAGELTMFGRALN